MNGTDKKHDDNANDISSTLKGKTLRVYWYMLRNPKEASLREIQRGTNLSSPSLATYHLDKLVGLGLVEVDPHGLFYLKQDVKVGVLRFFIGSGRFLVPRYFCYAIFYSTIIPLFFLLVPFILGPITFILLFVLSFGAVTSWIEAFRAWKMEI